MLVFILLGILVTKGYTENYSYEGYKIYQILPFEEHHLHLLGSFTSNNHFDFLSPLRKDGSAVEIMVDPDVQNDFESLLNQNAIRYSILSNNVESILQEERMWNAATPGVNTGRISFTKYHRHDAINAYLDQLVQDHAELVSLETVGKSYEGRDLKLIKISKNLNSNKPIIFIDAGIHAREWIAPPVALYAISQLVENSDNSYLLDKVDYHILPVVNPDGYEHTHTKQRLWRKTRSPNLECYGTDGNRNFDFHWAEMGSSDDECSEDYHGTRPFSEAETIAIRDYVLRNKHRIKLYLSFHSFGQLILYPWGYTTELPENGDELQALGESVAKSIESVNGTSYTVGSSTNILYPAAGGSDDWIKGIGNVELAYTIELPAGGLIGFGPRPKQILPIVTETWEGIKVFSQYISAKFG